MRQHYRLCVEAAEFPEQFSREFPALFG